MYCANNPVMFFDINGTFFLTFVATLVASATIGYLAYRGIEAVTNTNVANGSSSIAGGISTIATSASLFAYGPVGWVLGGIGVIAGIGLTLFGSAELQEGVSGENWIKDAGMSDGLYNGLYLASSISSFIVTIFGINYMQYANIKSTSYPRSGKPFQRFSLYDENGLKQYRFLDYKGNYWFDKDFRHTGNLKFPHYHGWENMIRTDGHWNLLQLIKWLIRR